MRGQILLSLTLLCVSGCVERTLTVHTEPQGALLYMNGLEVGRTPYQHDFVWYGKYDVELRKEGYETLKTRGNVDTPWWQWVPLDLITEILPFRFKDHQLLTFTLRPTSQAAVDPQAMLYRASQMQGQLESSQYTHPPIAPPAAATMASSRPTTRHASSRAATQPATRP